MAITANESSIPNSAPKLDQHSYQTDGLVTVGLPAEIHTLQQQFCQQTTNWLRHFSDPPIPANDLAADELAVELAQLGRRQRPLVGQLYKAARRFPATKQLACHPYFIACAQQLMNTELVSCCNFVSIRIDLPEESKYMVPPHQDFPYIQGSLNGITIWMPFTDISLDMGPPAWIAGSHATGMLPVRERSLADAGNVGAQIFEFADPPELADSDFRCQPITAQQALAFHTLLVHRSTPNQSDRARISIQLRFDDLANKESRQRNYPEGRYLDNLLADSYPEFVVE